MENSLTFKEGFIRRLFPVEKAGMMTAIGVVIDVGAGDETHFLSTTETIIDPDSNSRWKGQPVRVRTQDQLASVEITRWEKVPTKKVLFGFQEDDYEGETRLSLTSLSPVVARKGDIFGAVQATSEPQTDTQTEDDLPF